MYSPISTPLKRAFYNSLRFLKSVEYFIDNLINARINLHLSMKKINKYY